MKLFPILLILTTSYLSAHVYFNGRIADNNNIPREAWRVYDNSPAGATAKVIYDDNEYIKLEGEGRRNAYMLGGKKASSKDAWQDETNYIFSWKMKIDEKYRITLYAQTKKGSRKFNISYKRKDKGLYKKRYIGIGMGRESMNGEWQTFEIDLKAKLNEYEPDNKLIAINGVKVRGSGLFDDIILKANEFEEKDHAHHVQYVCQNQIKDKNVRCDDNLNIGYYIEPFMATRGVSYRMSTFDTPTATDLKVSSRFDEIKSINMLNNTSLLMVDYRKNSQQARGLKFFYTDKDTHTLKTALHIMEYPLNSIASYIDRKSLKLFDNDTKLSVIKFEEQRDPQNEEEIIGKNYKYLYNISDIRNIKLISKTEIVK